MTNLFIRWRTGPEFVSFVCEWRSRTVIASEKNEKSSDCAELWTDTGFINLNARRKRKTENYEYWKLNRGKKKFKFFIVCVIHYPFNILAVRSSDVSVLFFLYLLPAYLFSFFFKWTGSKACIRRLHISVILLRNWFSVLQPWWSTLHLYATTPTARNN